MKKLFFLACAFTGILYKQNHVDKSVLPDWSAEEVDNFVDDYEYEGTH